MSTLYKPLAWAVFPIAALALGALAASCAATTDVDGDEQTGDEDDALSGSDAVSRAQQWVSAKLHYCQAPNHARDYDAACSTYCNRHANAAWDPYRSDCSGLVSWAWGLPAPGRTTYGFAPFQTDITKTINATDLQPGDAINNDDHVMLFKKWVTKNHRATFLEEPGCSSSQPYARETTTDVSVSGSSIHVSSNGMTFTAIRNKGLGAAAPPPPSMASDRVAVSSWAEGRLDLFARNAKKHLAHRWYGDHAWHDWEDMGGTLTQSPAAVSWAPNRIDVFAVDTDSHLVHKWWDGHAWSGFEDLGGKLTSAPTVASWGERRLDVFARDGDNHLVHKYFRDGDGWSTWEDLGGSLGSTPTAVSWAEERLDIFAEDTHGKIVHRYFEDHVWHDWSSMMGDVVGGPAVASWAEQRLDLFGRGTHDDHLIHRWYTGGAWSDSSWEDLGGKLTSSPTTVSWGDGRIDVFGRNGDHVIHKYFDGGWSGWSDLMSP